MAAWTKGHTAVDDTETVTDLAGVQATVARGMDFDGEIEEGSHRLTLKEIDEEAEEEPDH